MDDVILSIYINFLLMSNGARIDLPKIERALWPLIRDDKDEDLAERFSLFLSEYAKSPNDLENWPIIRFFDIWAK
jgi:hypothetical protein